jgi:carnitine O-acetyltransferase
VKTCLGEHGLVTGETAGTTSTSVRVSFPMTTYGAVFTYFLVCSAVIVWDNGRSGFLGEHSCMDGTPTLRMNEFMLGSLAAKKIDFGPPLPSTSLAPPKEIVLAANDAVLANVQEAVRNFDKLVAAHDLRVLHYDVYGKNFIKQFKISPDAWAQLVKQLAFYKLKGRPAVTYESAQTRKFQRGRTEVIRAASSQSKAWVDAMVDPRATVRVIVIATCQSSPVDGVLEHG